MEGSVRNLLVALGEAPDREGLKDTPERVVKAWKEMVSGYQEDPAQVIGRALFNEPQTSSGSGTGVVCVRDIDFASISIENLMPYYGRCHIAYVPNKEAVLGLSKFARLVQVFSNRIQSQQTLATMLTQTIEKETRSTGVAVLIKAQHLGFRSSLQLPVVTFACSGVFKVPGTAREELRTTLLLNDLGSLEGFLKDQTVDSAELQNDIPIPSKGNDAYMAMKSLLMSLGVYNVVEGIESGLRSYVSELLHATSGYGSALPSKSKNKEDEMYTLHEDFSAVVNSEDLEFGSSASHQEDEIELSSGAEGPSSTQICSSRTGSSESLSDLSLENGGCCVQDIRWQLSDVDWPPHPSEEENFQEECFRFQSTCEHHLLPFSGHIYIGFIPRKGQRSIDSQKLEQIVSVFCLRLQLQERITHQIADAIQQMVDPTGLVVVARANHMCMVGRGVQSHSSTTVNSVINGVNTSVLLQKAAVALGDSSSIKRSARRSFWDPWQLEANLKSVLG